MTISDSELYIMDILWSQSPLNANQIVERLPTALDWTDKTAKTLINRLLKKGALDFQKEGRHYLYFPTITRQEIQSTTSKQILSRLFNGKLSTLVSHFADHEKLSEKEIAELEKIIKDMKS